jgi:hypothetical protein
MNAEEFNGKSGTLYVIETDVSGEEITVARDGTPVGSISLRFIEGDGKGMPDTYHITDMALNHCKGDGVGRRCLQFHGEMFDAPITAGTDDGSRPEDGSYLIDDGPGFIAKMRAEGIVCQIRHERDNGDDE